MLDDGQKNELNPITSTPFCFCSIFFQRYRPIMQWLITGR